MGPNLTQLYKCSRNGPAGEDLVAYWRLRDLFERHGEALLEALERLHRDSTASDFNEHWESYANVTQLLAQLEREAKP